MGMSHSEVVERKMLVGGIIVLISPEVQAWLLPWPSASMI